ncbi:hypothetical protein SUGI_0219700 [Cryptomeria japonica]|uniref:cytochrome P450 77A4 n=1 Tax=Cryptomeria japonica TaxID=3369 RepID=UPI002408EFCF|nr:cytochrome P450 77A4 [Cryptomeria japonica]GLJ13764.1 hypothetical protein SUGI_0219700 [Cryptomeria japonica]
MATEVVSVLRFVNVQTIALLLAVVYLIYRVRKQNAKKPNLPPGPPAWPILGNLVEVARRKKPFMCVVDELRKQYGPIFTLQMGQRTMIVVSSAELAHEALIDKGHVFANRPPETPTRNVFSCNKCTVNSAEYGALWRALRRNLVSEMLTATSASKFSPARYSAVSRLLDRLAAEAEANSGLVYVLSNCRFAVFCILLFMCFGIEFKEEVIESVDATLKTVLLTLEPRMDDFFPVLTPLFALSKQRNRVREVRQLQIDNILPLVNRRRQQLAKGSSSAAYVDSLFSLVLADGRELTNAEIVTLTSEFLNGGTDTTAAALEWAMAHLVADQKIQAKLYEEVAGICQTKETVEERDIEKMPYLNAVVKETLRMHPPTHFLLSHAVTEPSTLGGYDIPAKANVEFYTAAIGNDDHLWNDPRVFRPERFLEEDMEVDITGVKRIKMMPFGAGRRICPGVTVGTLHINLLVARMVQAFEWLPDPAHPSVDLTEEYAFTVIMKTPARPLIKPRRSAI